jgi:hypothetical protein
LYNSILLSHFAALRLRDFASFVNRNAFSDMAKRDNHYEAAFESWLRTFRLPFVAVDEAHRATFPAADSAYPAAGSAVLPAGGSDSLKSVDFIVSPAAQNESWLVDIKGRQFPTAGRQFWRNWSTSDELTSLANWEALFGPRFNGLLVFAYQVVGDRAPLAAAELFPFQSRLYGFVGVRLDHYTTLARPLSARWQTVTVPVPQFRAIGRPAREFFGVGLPNAGAA